MVDCCNISLEKRPRDEGILHSRLSRIGVQPHFSVGEAGAGGVLTDPGREMAQPRGGWVGDAFFIVNSYEGNPELSCLPQIDKAALGFWATFHTLRFQTTVYYNQTRRESHSDMLCGCSPIVCYSFVSDEDLRGRNVLLAL